MGFDFESFMERLVFNADNHTKDPDTSLRDIVTVEKALELHISRFWE
mgnify:CR=1 FL=1